MKVFPALRRATSAIECRLSALKGAFRDCLFLFRRSRETDLMVNATQIGDFSSRSDSKGSDCIY